jgi:hypothetical protein
MGVPAVVLSAHPGCLLSRTITVLPWIAALAMCGPVWAQESLRVLAMNRAQVGAREVTLAGVVPDAACASQATRDVTAVLGAQRGYFLTVPPLAADQGFVVLESGRTLNELAIETGCGEFAAEGLPRGHRYLTAMARARQTRDARRAGANAPEGPPTAQKSAPEPAARPWTGVANWSGSADATTQRITVPSGELRIMTLAIPRGGPGQVTVVVHDAGDGAPLQTIASGPVISKNQDVTPVRLEPGATVYFVISGANVLWGVWAEVK